MTSYIQLDAEANAIQVSLIRLLNGAFLDGYVIGGLTSKRIQTFWPNCLEEIISASFERYGIQR